MLLIPRLIWEKTQMSVVFKDELTKYRFLARVVVPVLIASFVLHLAELGLAGWLFANNRRLQESRAERLVLVPIAGPGPITVEGKNGQLDSSYILDAAIKAVGLQENWSWLNIRGNYTELYTYHASKEFENFHRVNVEQTQFPEKVEANRMVSTFQIDRNKSRAEWCPKLNAACAIVSGRRYVFINGNVPLSDTAVAYFIISNVVYPTKEQPNALRIHRQVVIDKGDDPAQTAEPMLSAAMSQGVLPETHK
jgi:hypothetical protein